MNFKSSVGLLYFVTIASTCSGHVGEDIHLHQDLTPRVYCGRVLARALAYLCNDETLNDKRSDGTMYNAILAPYYKHRENSGSWPWMPQHKARAMGILSRGKRLIVNECCEKSCNINELLSYC
ncbi:unnamed protein product [Euphydryas editha]|uniref:Insulin-like domain-containing protein n=1 Tax=Euphydryas editha TaxID=104508 RepID=A0AAU9TWV4_EUPED|nr:unnamed protein product [Euphydryas editha]